MHDRGRMPSPPQIDPADLPATIRDFLAAHLAHDATAALSALSSDAVVVDDGRTFRGTAELTEFFEKAGTEYTYTTDLVAAARVDDEHWLVTNHLEGDFPGGVVDLIYRFTLAGDRIAELVIAP